MGETTSLGVLGVCRPIQRTIYYNAAPGEDPGLEDMFVPFPHEVLDSSGRAEDGDHGSKKSTPSTDLDEPTRPAMSDASSNTVPVKAESLFQQAISNAIVKHDDRLPIPSSSKVKLSDLPSPVDSGLVLQSESALLPREDFSDSDDEEDTKQSKALAEVDEDVAKMLLYTPTGKWASFANEPIVDVEVVADLNNTTGAKYDAYLKRGTLGGKRITYISKTWKFYEEWEGLFSELALYSGNHLLRPLQGEVVPSIIGVYVGVGEISVAMALPDSQFWIEASSDMPDALKNKCLAAFDRIHACGIVHGAPELRNILIGSNGDVTIINFNASRARTPNDNVKLKECTQEEVQIEALKIRHKLNRSWIKDAKFKPTVYIVPGQEPGKVKAALQLFRGEMSRDAEEKTMVPGEENKKRKRHEDEGTESCNERLSPEQREARRKSRKRAKEWQEATLAALQTDDSTSAPPAPPSGVNNYVLPDGTNETSKAYIEQGFLVDPLNPVINVPYDGYTRPGSFTFANHYTPFHLSKMRKDWIMMDCIEQARSEGLPYPVGIKGNLTPATNGAKSRARITRWRKSKGLGPDPRVEEKEKEIKKMLQKLSLGEMRRKMEERRRGEWTWDKWVEGMGAKKERYLRYRFFERTGEKLEGFEEEEYEEYMDLDADGQIPRILTWREFEARVGKEKAKHVPLEEESPVASWDRDAKPTKEILRVQISEEERFANRILEVDMDARLAAYIEESENSSSGPGGRQSLGRQAREWNNNGRGRHPAAAPKPARAPGQMNGQPPSRNHASSSIPSISEEDDDDGPPINILAMMDRIHSGGTSRCAPPPRPLDNEVSRRRYSATTEILHSGHAVAEERKSVTPQPQPGAYPMSEGPPRKRQRTTTTVTTFDYDMFDFAFGSGSSAQADPSLVASSSSSLFTHSQAATNAQADPSRIATSSTTHTPTRFDLFTRKRKRSPSPSYSDGEEEREVEKMLFD